MKKLLILGLLAAFAYAAFVPPAGVKKLPSASVQFRVDTGYGALRAELGPHERNGIKPAPAKDNETPVAE